ncbi:MAG: hypothetical protein ACJAUG_002269 [Halioglobus sp.]|jgi:hypothetical protein
MNDEKISEGGLSTRRYFLEKTGSTFAGLALSAPLFAGESQPIDSIAQPPGTNPTTQQMVRNLRRANQVAARAMEAGHHPFGAILVAADHETVLMEQGNINAVNHAESTLARLAAESFTEAERWTMTLYSTAEPCTDK